MKNNDGKIEENETKAANLFNTIHAAFMQPA
jgi:hypothetical protein